jgi:hypothetical protein
MEKRFWKHISPEPNTGCWLWTGTANMRGYGYGSFTINKKSVNSHRVSFELFRGPIPIGMHVCHKCDVPLCVNPEHLFLGTRSDNQRDRVVKGRHNEAQKTHCPKGHQYILSNLLKGRKGRVCRQCNRIYQNHYYHTKLKLKRKLKQENEHGL